MVLQYLWMEEEQEAYNFKLPSFAKSDLNYFAKTLLLFRNMLYCKTGLLFYDRNEIINIFITKTPLKPAPALKNIF